MEFQSEFVVEAPIEAVYDFHRSAESLQAITPPVIPMTSIHAPDQLIEGSELEFTLWLGPFPVRWSARIEDTTSNGFTDRQTSGPFAAWSHRHSFEALGDNRTLVEDHVTYDLKSHPFWWFVGGSMAVGLPLLFRFRAYKTRKILERD